MNFKPDPEGEAARGGGFYVSVVHGRSYRLALGPFETHADAQSRVPLVRDYVSEHDPRGWFYLYGTARVTEGNRPAGVLNEALGQEA